jgi:UDP-glucose 4-epimerase
MRVLVTGAAGQLGSYLLDDLFPRHEVLGIDLLPGRAEHSRLMGRADIRDREEMLRVCEGMDAIVHCAAQVSVERSMESPLHDMDLNVTGTVNLLKAAVDSKVRRFVYISSAATYGDPLYVPVDEEHPLAPKSFYGVGKVASEAYVRAFTASMGIEHVIIRPFNLYSPRADPRSPYSGVITKFSQWAKGGKALRIEGDGEQTRDFVHTVDAARFIRLALESEASDVTVNCGGGKAITVNQLAEAIVGTFPDSAGVEHVAPRLGDIKHSRADISLARRLYDFSPEISLREGIRTFL